MSESTSTIYKPNIPDSPLLTSWYWFEKLETKILQINYNCVDGGDFDNGWELESDIRWNC